MSENQSDPIPKEENKTEIKPENPPAEGDPQQAPQSEVKYEGTQQQPQEANTEQKEEEQQQEEAQEPKKPKGPYDIDEQDLTPRFVRAMQVCGYCYDDLQMKNRKQIIEIVKQKDPLGTKIDEELVMALSNHLEQRRKIKVDEVRNQRRIVQVQPPAQNLNQSSVIEDKSIIVDKSIISQFSKSIFTKAIDPLELEFLMYDKIKKKERAQIFKAQQEEALLVKQVEYEAKQKILQEKLQLRRKEEQKKKHQQQQQKKDIEKWLHNRTDADSSSIFNQAQYIQIVQDLHKELEETLKSRQFLNEQEKIDKVQSMQDLRMKEVQDLQLMRENSMQSKLEVLKELSTLIHNDKQSKHFFDLQRELSLLIKDEQVLIRKELMEEYKSFIKSANQSSFKNKKAEITKNLTRMQIAQQMKNYKLIEEQQSLDQRLENFKKLQEDALKSKRQGQLKRTTSEQTQNKFSLMKMDYERRVGFQDDMIREIDRVDNITRKHRKEEQYKLDNLVFKEQLKQDRREQEISKFFGVVSKMKKFEHTNSQTTLKQMSTIRNKHTERDQELKVQIEKLRKQEEELLFNKEQQKQLEKKERLRQQIDDEKKRIQQEEQLKASQKPIEE